MSVEDLPRSVTVDETRRSLLLWFAVLGSPLAWAGHLVLNYSLEEWFACSPSATHQGEILGFTVAQVSVVLNAAMALIAVAAGVTGLACWRRLRRRKFRPGRRQCASYRSIGNGCRSCNNARCSATSTRRKLPAS